MKLLRFPKRDFLVVSTFPNLETSFKPTLPSGSLRGPMRCLRHLWDDCVQLVIECGRCCPCLDGAAMGVGERFFPRDGVVHVERHLLHDFRNLESEFRPKVATSFPEKLLCWSFFFSTKSYFLVKLLLFFRKEIFWWFLLFRTWKPTLNQLCWCFYFSLLLLSSFFVLFCQECGPKVGQGVG